MFEQVKDYKSACKVLGIKPIDISRDAAEYAAKTFKPLYMKHIFGID